MAFVSLLRRTALPALLSAALTTCSISDGLVPPENVDHGTRVSSISPRQPVRMAPAQSQPYPAASAPVANTQGQIDYLDTPNLAGSGQQMRAPPQPMSQPGQRLPMIDSDEALAQSQGRQVASNGSWGGVQPLAVPKGGVNMDDELGVQGGGVQGEDQPVVGLAQDEQQQIAEGNATEPVVDGIGTENPRQLNQGRVPQPVAATQMSRQPMRAAGSSARTWNDGSPVLAPTRVPEEDEPEQVAMLRPNNPMMSEPVAPIDPGVMPASELSCRRELKRMGVIFEDKPAISNGPSCQVPYPVSLKGLSGNIGVKPAVTLNCQVTLAFAKWVKNELAPSARFRYWTGIKTIEPLGGYSCRRMNNSLQRYNPISEHAKGNAIDVGKFVLKDGHEIDVRKKGLFSFREGRLLKAVRSDSCSYFTTVLGPGYNPEHWNHFHFDLMSRKGGRSVCK
jgi:hypothetical protein